MFISVPVCIFAAVDISPIFKDLTIISADQPNIEDVQLNFQDCYMVASYHALQSRYYTAY